MKQPANLPKAAASAKCIFSRFRRAKARLPKICGRCNGSRKKERADILGRIDETMHKAFLQGMVGQNAEVLFEQPAGEDYFEGLTGNYQRVFVKAAAVIWAVKYCL